MALRAICKFTDWAVQTRMVYGSNQTAYCPTCFICYIIPNLL